MPGPAPKPAEQRRRVNKTNALIRLPMSGRPGPAPEWPLPRSKPSCDAMDLWKQLWATPQAVAWERFGWVRNVARYVTVCLTAESTLHPAALAETRQLEDRLGLSPMAMLRLRWEMTDDAPEVAEPAGVTAITKYKAMLGDDNA